MSLQGLNDQDLSWTFRNSLTINNNVEVNGDLNTTGFIYDGNIPISVLVSNNVWTGNNLFKNFQPTFLAPVADEDMTTYDYMDTAYSTLGQSLLPTTNTWTLENTMSVLPTITNAATASTNEVVNKGTADTYVNTSNGNLGTVNNWTGENTFAQMIVPTPATDNAFANKKYVDDSIAAFNAAGGRIDYVESIIQSGSLTVDLDPAVYTGMIVALVSAGGEGAPPATVPSGSTRKSFGGSGGYGACKVPAYTGSATYTIGVGSSQFTLPNGTNVLSVTVGGVGAEAASGAGGVVSTDPSLINVQNITGSVEPLQNPITDDSITNSYNIGCLNGYGEGGSFRWDTGTSVPATGYYALFIKFKK